MVWLISLRKILFEIDLNEGMKKIVWLASYPKSGNTWLRVFLENYLNPNSEGISINQMVNTTIASSRFLIDAISGVSSANLLESEIEELRPKVYCNFAEKLNSLQFLKVHDSWKRTPSGASMFPSHITKGVIYLTRNPLDIAISFAHHSSKKINTTILDMNNKAFSFCGSQNKKNHQVKQILSDWSGHVVSWLDESNLPVLVIRYEDMLNDPSCSFRKALEFLDFRIEEDQFLKALATSEFRVLQQMEQNEGFNEKPLQMKSFFRQGTAGDWKHILTSDQTQEIVLAHKTQMERFNYNLD